MNYFIIVLFVKFSKIIIIGIHKIKMDCEFNGELGQLITEKSLTSLFYI